MKNYRNPVGKQSYYDSKYFSEFWNHNYLTPIPVHFSHGDEEWIPFDNSGNRTKQADSDSDSFILKESDCTSSSLHLK